VRLVQRVIQVSEVQLVLPVKPVIQVYRFSATEELSEQLDVQVNCYNIQNDRRRRHGADGEMHPKFLTLNRCRCRRHNSVSICCCIQGQKVRLGTLEQLEALEQLDQRVLQVRQV